MPRLFQFNPIDHVKPGDPPKAFAVSETSKAGASSFYLITAWFVHGPIGNASTSGYAFEVGIGPEMFAAMKASGQFGLVEFAEKPDSPCQQFQGDWNALNHQIRTKTQLLNTMKRGTPEYDVLFDDIEDLSFRRYKVERDAKRAGCAIETFGKV